jgi:hypothetical protein
MQDWNVAKETLRAASRANAPNGSARTRNRGREGAGRIGHKASYPQRGHVQEDDGSLRHRRRAVSRARFYDSAIGQLGEMMSWGSVRLNFIHRNPSAISVNKDPWGNMHDTNR